MNINWLFHQELNALDIKESSIYTSQSDDEIAINVDATLIDYSRSTNHFRIRIYLPEEIANQVGKDVLESDTLYSTHGRGSKTYINENFNLSISKALLPSLLFYDKEYIFQLYNEKETVEIITIR
jgi:hypothetical protein